MKHTRKIATISCLGALLFNTQAMATSCLDDANSCSVKDRWYIGAEYGAAETQMNDSAVDRFFDRTGISRDVVHIDDDNDSVGVLLGYYFTENLALEGSYRNLGNRSLSYTGSPIDQALFETNATAIYPESGDGLTLGAVVSWPLTPRWKLSGKAGVMRWETDNQVTDGTLLGRVSTDGTDLYFGAETSYMLTPNVQTYLGFTRFHLDRDEVDVFGLGLRVFFGGDKGQPSSPAPKASSVQPSAIQQPAKPAMSKTEGTPKEGDADGDGVLDSKDNCANTPSSHMVDSKGCTRYKPINYEHELTIYYPNNSSKIDESYMSKIDALVAFAKEHDIKQFKIVGHTSAPGEADYNQWLSERRAQSLAKILKDKYGYRNDQIEAMGEGENKLAVMGNNEAAHSKNRRLVVHLSASEREPMLKR